MLVKLIWRKTTNEKIVEKGSRLIARDDEDVSETVKEILENEGINIRLNVECMAAEKDGDKVRVKLDCDKGDKAVTGSHLLLAVGRIPNTDDLGLDEAGVDMDGRGYIRVDDQLRTGSLCTLYDPELAISKKSLQ